MGRFCSRCLSFVDCAFTTYGPVSARHQLAMASSNLPRALLPVLNPIILPLMVENITYSGSLPLHLLSPKSMQNVHSFD